MINEGRWVRASVLVVLFSLWWTGGVIFCPEHSIFLWAFVAGYEFSILEVDCNLTMLIPALCHLVSDRVFKNRQETVQVFSLFVCLQKSFPFALCRVFTQPHGFNACIRLLEIITYFWYSCRCSIEAVCVWSLWALQRQQQIMVAGMKSSFASYLASSRNRFFGHSLNSNTGESITLVTPLF